MYVFRLYTGSFVGVLGKTLPSPSIVRVKLRRDVNSVCCRHDMTELVLKVA